MGNKRLQEMELARRLYFYTSLSTSHIAQRVGVSVKSICNWKKKGEWEKIKEKELRKPPPDISYANVMAAMDELKKYLKKNAPELSPAICSYINSFLLDRLL